MWNMDSTLADANFGSLPMTPRPSLYDKEKRELNI